MPVQTQNSDFFKRLGSRVAEANAEHRDKPVDLGNRRLPGGIRDGVARLSSMYTKAQTDKGGKIPEGETFFRASAIVVSPDSHKGQKVEGMVTSLVIPLCDIEAKGQRKAVSFTENWFEFQNLFKQLGINPPDSKDGAQIQAYYFAAMAALTSPERLKTNPVFIAFSTREWKPDPTNEQPNPEPMVFESWHGLAKWDGKPVPGGGMEQGPPLTPPPPQTKPAPQVGAAAPPVGGPPPQQQPDGDSDREDKDELVAALVEAATSDPEGADGIEATAQLEQMAWAAGWSKADTAGAADWTAVGDMALTPKGEAQVSPPKQASEVKVGARFMYAKRTKDGERLKGKDGSPFAAQEVEVVSVDDATGTCTVKTTKDGKDVVDIRSKKPVAVKFEWLEASGAPPY